MTDLQTLAFEHDGTPLVGEIAMPQGSGPFPAVMVMHNALGMDDLLRDRARALARLGYVAVVTDMYGRGSDGFRNNPKSGGELMMALVNAPARLRARVVAWFEQIKMHPHIDAARIAAIGYCFGGQCVLELARSGADIKAMVSFHGLLTTAKAAEKKAVRGQLAIYTGAKDPYAPSTDVDALREEFTHANAGFQITVFNDAYHAFTDPRADTMGRPGIAYNKIADRVSWAGMLALLEVAV